MTGQHTLFLPSPTPFSPQNEPHRETSFLFYGKTAPDASDVTVETFDLTHVLVHGRCLVR